MNRFISTLFVLVNALSGCGAPKTHSISGTVLHGGEKMTWPDGGTLLVIFMSEDETRAERYVARETDTAMSTYKITGIPPGRYKVAVQQFFPDAKTNFNDALSGKYDPGHTNLVVEVTQDGQVLDIEVPKTAPAAGAPKGGKGGRKKGDPKEAEKAKEPGK